MSPAYRRLKLPVRCSPHLGPMGLRRNPMACANVHASPYGAVSLTRARRIRRTQRRRFRRDPAAYLAKLEADVFQLSLPP